MAIPMKPIKNFPETYSNSETQAWKRRMGLSVAFVLVVLFAVARADLTTAR